MRAYLDFFTADHKLARAITVRYADHPVDRWRKRFAEVSAQLDEIEGKAPAVIDKEDRTQQQTKLAATEPGLEIEIEGRKITLQYQNLASCRVNYYIMDIELLFSRNPFVRGYSGQFSYIRPNATRTVALSKRRKSLSFEIPAGLRNKNLLVEVEAAGIRKAATCFSNSLAVELVENYGQLRVTHNKRRRPLPQVYVKVYARTRNGAVRFYKDGYTDLRGRFDYVSLSTNDLDNTERFSILVLSKEHGGVVREASPPKR